MITCYFETQGFDLPIEFDVIGRNLIFDFCLFLDDAGINYDKGWQFYGLINDSTGSYLKEVAKAEVALLLQRVMMREAPVVFCKVAPSNGYIKEFSLNQRIGWLKGTSFHDVFFGIKIRIDILGKDVEQFFLHIGKKYTPPFFRFSTRIDSVNLDTDLALNMCLERSKGFMEAICPEWVWAKEHFSLFPKMQYEGAALFKRKLVFMPERIGWLNWWSAEVCEYIGFPNPEKDVCILPLCERMPTGHWFVKLTEEPLDLERPDHVEIIAWAYWRFDKIGLRVKPSAKKTKKPAAKTIPTSVAGSLVTFRIFERDEAGNWWEAAFDPVQAESSDHALRIFFARQAKGRLPKPRETLDQLRKAYDEVAMEVDLPMSDAYEARSVVD
ncbi:DUF5953 family protein [Ottowia testudinis]|uniref:Uncharacterized protein n=1 Tax=Ottowia testudinis TaxID=2816950 RepID=A0A975CF68_9BURK|nr:DUF5953 family protein [Ottowia testudinis]QTD43717.1 hypothetical protein J1M35_11140 [Ottowia testudinis]